MQCTPRSNAEYTCCGCCFVRATVIVLFLLLSFSRHLSLCVSIISLRSTTMYGFLLIIFCVLNVCRYSRVIIKMVGLKGERRKNWLRTLFIRQSRPTDRLFGIKNLSKFHPNKYSEHASIKNRCWESRWTHKERRRRSSFLLNAVYQVVIFSLSLSLYLSRCILQLVSRWCSLWGLFIICWSVFVPVPIVRCAECIKKYRIPVALVATIEYK